MGFGYQVLVWPVDESIAHPQCLDLVPLLMGMSPSPVVRKQPTHGHRGGGVGVGARRGWEEWGMGGEESGRRESKTNQEGQKTD